jgi:hypothetical protein
VERRQHPPSGRGHKHSRFNREGQRVGTKKRPVTESFPRGQIDGFDWSGFFQNGIVKSSTFLEIISTSNQKWTHSCKYGGGDGPRVPLVSPIAVIELLGYSELKVWFVELVTPMLYSATVKEAPTADQKQFLGGIQDSGHAAPSEDSSFATCNSDKQSCSPKRSSQTQY